MKNSYRSFWYDLWDSWRGKRLILGIFYENLENAQKHCRRGQAVYKVNDGYMVARDVTA